MKSKISQVFENCKKEKRPALITYTVAGDNTKNNSLKILNAISKHADILELGFPHNTPIADGGQIQGSSHRALKRGIKLKDVFQIVKNFKKKEPKKPLILMGQLLSPTTSKERMKKIIKDSHDMIYYISMLSTTGGKLKVSPRKIMQNYNVIKKINPKKNLVIGFGITDKTISSLKSANGLVVGSMLCKTIANCLKIRQNPVIKLDKMVRALKRKIV